MFKYCKKCVAIRQFLPEFFHLFAPNGYDDIPRHCDVCGAEE